ncbi:MAG: sulfite exporter TauE/SafE family protein [Firmicutes bacterium]|nr:sulfite exporter TauE/SafE family protein [Bacillota bacterium]
MMGTAIGSGGGFLLSPILLLVYGLSPARVAGTSLLVILINVLSGTVAYARRGTLDLRSGWRFALASVPGAVLATALVGSVSNRLFQLLLGLLLFLIASLILFRVRGGTGDTDQEGGKSGIGGDENRSEDPAGEWNGKPARGEDPFTAKPIRGGSGVGSYLGRCRNIEIRSRDGRIHRYCYNQAAGLAISFLIASVSALFGLGGGILHVPAMVFFLSFPPHVAAATSHFVQIATAGIGAGGHMLMGNVDFALGLPLAAGVLLGAQAGAWLACRVRGRVIMYFLSGALALVGTRLVAGL